MSGEKFLHGEWVNRTSIPCARRFISGHHCTEADLDDVNYGGRWKEHKKSFFHGSRKEKKIDTFSSDFKPEKYNNDMYDQPYIMKQGYHVRKYLLREENITEQLVPIIYDRPYYIDRVNQNGDIHRYYLSDASKQMGVKMAKKYEGTDKYYSYSDELLWKKQQENDEALLKKKQQWATSRAQQKEHEKFALQMKIKREEELDKANHPVEPVGPYISPLEKEMGGKKLTPQLSKSDKMYVGEQKTVTTMQRTTTSTLDPILSKTNQPMTSNYYVEEPQIVYQQRSNLTPTISRANYQSSTPKMTTSYGQSQQWVATPTSVRPVGFNQ